MSDPWEPFLVALNSPWDHARAFKARGGKVTAHMLPDVPPELIHAAGAFPVAVYGAGNVISRAQEYLPGYTCAHAMGILEMGLAGKLDFIDALIIPYTCDTTRNFFHVWNRAFPQLKNEFLRLPKRFGYAAAEEYLVAEFTRIYEWLCEVTGAEPAAAPLAKSIELYNRIRALLRDAYRAHRTNPDLWSAGRLHAMLFASTVVPPELFLSWMEPLPWNDVIGSSDRTPIYVRGKIWDPPGIVDLFDRLGLVVAGDELVTGMRAIQHDAEGPDPIRALVKRHFNSIPYAGYHLEPAAIVSDFIARVRQSEAVGVVFLNPKFCEAAGFDAPDMRNALNAAAIPHLTLETSSGGIGTEQVALRLEAFRETLTDGPV